MSNSEVMESMVEGDGILSMNDAMSLGFKVAEMADRVKLMHSVVPKSKAEWRFVMDDIEFDVVVTVHQPT